MISREEARQKSEQINKELEEARISNIEENCKGSLAILSDMIESQIAAGEFSLQRRFIDIMDCDRGEDTFQNRRDLVSLLANKYGYNVDIGTVDGIPVRLMLAW